MLIIMYTGDKFMICIRNGMFNIKVVLYNGLKVSLEVTPLKKIVMYEIVQMCLFKRHFQCKFKIFIEGVSSKDIFSIIF